MARESGGIFLGYPTSVKPKQIEDYFEDSLATSLNVKREYAFSIDICGFPLGLEHLRLVDRIKIEDTREDADTCTFYIVDRDYLYGGVFLTGNSIKVEVGYLEGGLVKDKYVFIGEVVNISYDFNTDGLPVLKVQCFCRVKELMEAQKHINFLGFKRSVVAQKIVDSMETPLDAVIVQTEDVIDTLVQAGITDAAMLRSMAREEDYLFKVRGNTLYFGPEEIAKLPEAFYSYLEGDHSISSAELKYETDDEARVVQASQVDEATFATVTAGSETPGTAETAKEREYYQYDVVDYWARELERKAREVDERDGVLLP